MPYNPEYDAWMDEEPQPDSTIYPEQAAPQAQGPADYTPDWIAEQMRSQGVSEHVIGEEAGAIARYGEQTPDVIARSMPQWLERSKGSKAQLKASAAGPKGDAGEGFSGQITGGYQDLLNNKGLGTLDQQMASAISGLISRGGKIDEDPALQAQRMEARRQPIEAFRRMEGNQMRAELANRGLLSEPGQEQGAEIGAAGRFEEQLAPYYATAGQNLASEMGQADDQRYLSALGIGGDLGSAQSKSWLDALGGANSRQAVLSSIALGTLDRNMAWNQFLAEFGLKREQAMHEIQSGNSALLNAAVQWMQNNANASRGGYV